jgi:hypothetical protein
MIIWLIIQSVFVVLSTHLDFQKINYPVSRVFYGVKRNAPYNHDHWLGYFLTGSPRDKL